MQKKLGNRVSMSVATAKAYVLDMDADSIKKLLMSVHKRKVSAPQCQKILFLQFAVLTVFFKVT